MAYLDESQLARIGFKSVGKNVKISDKAIIYNPEEISIGDFSRIDDLCVLSGKIKIGRFVHVTPMCLIAGGLPGIEISDYCTLAYGVKIFSQSDDYSGESMVNSLIPKMYKKELFAKTVLQKQVIVGAGAVIMPGVTVSVGCAIGALALINKSTNEWGIYAGVPGKRISERSKNILKLQEKFEKTLNDTI